MPTAMCAAVCDFERIDHRAIRCRNCGQERRWSRADCLPVAHCGPARKGRARGLGDTLTRIAEWCGFPTCGGCKGRAATLNKWFPYAEGKAQERAAARLEICGGCDQRINRVCTMNGQDLVELAPQAAATCPMARWPGEEKAVAVRANRPKRPGEHWLLRFPHGLGDTVQLTIVLAHQRRAWPDLSIDVQVRAGCASLFAGLANRAWVIDQDGPPVGPYDQVLHIAWREPLEAYPDAPSSKAVQCLRQVFGLPAVAELCRYRVPGDPSGEALAREYLARVAEDRPAVLIHPRGRCGPKLKDMPDDIAAAAIAAVVGAGGVPLVLDFDRVLPLHKWDGAINAAEEESLWMATAGSRRPIGDAAAIAELARQCALCIGVDSGPGHLFGAVATPALIVWRKLHPINYFDLAGNVEHWLPPQHGQFIRGDRETALGYFRQHYRHVIFQDLAVELGTAIERRLRDARPLP